MIVTGNNNNLALYDVNAVLLKKVKLNLFFGVTPIAGVGQSVFDPEVLYDPIRDRWVICADYAEYNLSNGNFSITNNKLYIAFSQSSDPSGNWNIYSVSGISNVDGTVWGIDYPTMAFTKTELFVVASLSKLGKTISHQVIYEMSFNEGYSNQPLTMRKHILEDISGMCAAHNNFSNDNTRLYILHSAQSPPSVGTKHLDIAFLESKLSDTTNKISPLYHLDLADFYYAKPGSAQKGGAFKLAQAGSVVRSCFYDKGIIYGSFTTVKNNKTSVYYFRVVPNETDLDFSTTYSMVIEHPTYELGYSSVNFNGSRSGSTDGVLIAVNYTSANDYPGYGVYNVSPAGEVSNFVTLKSGEGYYNWVQSLDSFYARWGDYTSVSMQNNLPGKLLVTGQYAMNDNRVGSHFAIISNPSAGIAMVEKNNNPAAYPNPAEGAIYLKFVLKKSGNYKILVSDMSGKIIKQTDYVFLEPGLVALDMDASSITNGAYFLQLVNEEGKEVILREKIIVKK